MAKLVTTFICFFLLFAVSHARFSLEENEDTVQLPPLTYLNLDHKPVSEPAKAYKSTVVSELAKPDESTVSKTETVPLTTFSFHPINRNLPLVRHRHNCRHGIKPQGGHDRYISYGKDMILSREKFLGVDPAVRGSPPAVRGSTRPQIPAMWERFNQDPPRFDVNDHHHRRHHDHEHHHRHHDHAMDGFMSKIRKFLGQF
jgi:hypothetical protein